MKCWRDPRSRSVVFAAFASAALVAASTITVAPTPSGATPNDITLTINTSAPGCADATVYLPLYSANGASLNATIDFGDGTSAVTDTTSGVDAHTYASLGSYTITITGTVPQFGTANPAVNSADCSLVAVTNWDGVGLTSLNNAFDDDINLASVPTDLPGTVTDLTNTFRNAYSFDQNLETWNSADVIDMNSMFFGDTAFNNGGAPLATTSGGWDTSNVSDMAGMFESTAFNQDIESWNTSTATDMSAMFENDNAFDNDGDPLITTSGGWNTANVIDMNSIFYNDYAIDVDADSWNTSQVTDMSFMFFDDPLFDNGESPFATQSGGWSTADVTDMYEMFTFDTDFNQDVSSWNTSSVTNMYYLFFKTTAFNQDLGQWSLASATDVTGMLDNTSLSTSNYDATLVGWANQTVPSGLTFGASGLTYDVYGAAARNTLTSSPDDWTIQYDSEVAPYGFPARAPTQQATLTLTATASNPLGQSVTLSANGGSGTGAVTFDVTGGTASGCAVSGNVLTSTSVGTCIVTATKASDSTYAASTSTPVVITFIATAPPAPPARLTIGFAPRSHALGAGARRALVNLSRKLASSDTVTVTSYALHDASLARLRATAVDGLLKHSGAHVKIVTITRTAANKSVVVTRA